MIKIWIERVYQLFMNNERDMTQSKIVKWVDSYLICCEHNKESEEEAAQRAIEDLAAEKQIPIDNDFFGDSVNLEDYQLSAD